MSQGPIPIVDFAAFPNGTLEEKKAIANQVMDAFRTVGFLILQHHTVPQPLVDAVFDRSKAFFDLPPETKNLLQWECAESNRGYVPPGMEKLSNLDTEGKHAELQELQQTAPDMKESMEIGKEPSPKWQNMWPAEDDAPKFKETMTNFFNTAHGFHVHVIQCIALALGQDEHALDDYVDGRDCNLRLLHYPECEKSAFANGRMRAGEHTDYGSITMVFTHKSMTISGLQVKQKDGSFASAPFVENSVVVNAGDLLQRWSNDTICSNVHRVVGPVEGELTEDGRIPARYSVVLFCNPNFDRSVHVLPGCSSEGNPPKYPPVNSLDYLVSRLSATYFK